MGCQRGHGRIVHKEVGDVLQQEPSMPQAGSSVEDLVTRRCKYCEGSGEVDVGDVLMGSRKSSVRSRPRREEIRLAQNGGTILQDVAIHLSWNLHSAARENIVSSLLAASINESECFKEWFLDQIGYDRRHSRRQLYAEPNHDIVTITKTIKRTRQNYRNKRFPRYPDILISDSNDRELWRSLEEVNRNRRLSPLKKGELSDALNRIWAVLIEVKHTALGQDAGKYDNLIDGLSSYDRPGHLSNRHRFVIISSHSEKAKERVETKIANDERTTSDEKKWHRFFNRADEGVMHVTLASIYGIIREKHRIWCHDSPMLQLFEYYLALHLGVFDNTSLHREYWRQVVKGDDSPYGLKWSIADHINWLACSASVKTVGHKWDGNDTDNLTVIQFKPSDKYGCVVEFISGERCEDLTIIIGKKSYDLKTAEIIASGDTRGLIKVLTAVSKYVD